MHASASDAGGDGLAAYTRRQFKRGSGGAAGRKEVLTMAVAEDGALYTVAPPEVWHWRVEYEVQVHVAAEQGGAAQWVRATVRLGQMAHGERAAAVAAVRVKPDGSRIPHMPALVGGEYVCTN